MATLNQYLRQVQRFIRDPSQMVINPDDLIDYINQARRQVAMQTECVRILPATSGSITTAQLKAGGSGYTHPTVTITAPDYPSGLPPAPNGRQATAIALYQGGIITAVVITDGGDGYFQPVATISDPTGHGAACTLNTVPLALVTEGQEVYPFTNFDLTPFPGVDSIYAVKSVTIIFSQFRYSVIPKSFSEYQALIRQYASGLYQYVPAVFAQYGQGASGSLYMYPLPNQTYQIELDCFCMPSDLTTDQDVEVIPQPWNDAVPYFAAHLAYLELQNFNAAKMYLELFGQRVNSFSVAARPGMRNSFYGRG